MLIFTDYGAILYVFTDKTEESILPTKFIVGKKTLITLTALCGELYYYQDTGGRQRSFYTEFD